MHEKTQKIFASGMTELKERLLMLAPEERALVSRVLRLDIDLLSVAALNAGALEDALRDLNSPLLDTATCLHQLLAQAIRLKVETVGKLALDDPNKAIER